MIYANSEGTEDMSARQQVEEKATELRNSYDNCSVRVTDVGGNVAGIEVTVLGEGLVEVELDKTLENIDRELYEDGYNTAWITEDAYLKARDKPKEEWESHGRVGMTAALPSEYGKPEMPGLNSEQTTSHRNTHRE